MTKLERLKEELTSIKEKMCSAGCTCDENDIANLEAFERYCKHIVENIYKRPYSEVSSLDIFDEMILNPNWSSDIVESIVNSIEPLKENLIKEKNGALVETGHSLEEYMKKWSELYDAGELWDFSKEDFLDGTIEINPEMIYWLIKDDSGEWRYFETTVCEEKEEACNEEEKDARVLAESTPNFPTRFPHKLPLLVFLTYDEVEDAMRSSENHPKEIEFEDEDGNVDYDAYYDAVEKYEEKFVDDLDCAIFTEEDVENLKEVLHRFNSETKEIADKRYDDDSEESYNDLNLLSEIKLEVEPGYYSGAYVNVENEKKLDSMSDEFKEKQIKRLKDFMNSLKKDIGISEFKVKWGPASNGETSYIRVKDESLKEAEEVERIEFCIMDKDNNNIECFDELEDAVKFAKENEGERILRVLYGPRDEHGDEPELGAECVWSVRESLTEAEEDDLSDDELDALDAEEEKAFRQKQAERRARVADKRKEKEDKKAKLDVILKEIGDEFTFDKLVDKLVPDSGKADTVAGELIRALHNIDAVEPFFVGEGLENDGSYMAYIANFFDEEADGGENKVAWDINENILDVAGDFETYKEPKKYGEFLKKLKEDIVNYIKDHNELLVKSNKDDSKIKFKANEYWKEYIPTFDIEDCELPSELKEYLELGVIDDNDVIEYIRNILLDLEGSTNDIEVEDDTYVNIKDLSYNDFKSLGGERATELYDYLDVYAINLEDEHGTSDEIRAKREKEKSEEETDESLKESKGLVIKDVKPGQTFKPLKDLFYCDIEEEGMFEDDESLIKEFTDNGFKLEGTSLIIPAGTVIKFAISQSVDSYEIGDYSFDVGEWSEEAENTPVEIISIDESVKVEDCERAQKIDEMAKLPYGVLAWKLGEIMMAMNNEDAYYGGWLYIWPDGETKEDCMADFGTKESYEELRQTFEKYYKAYHDDGLYTDRQDIVDYAHKIDAKLGLEPIKNFGKISDTHSGDDPYGESLTEDAKEDALKILKSVLTDAEYDAIKDNKDYIDGYLRGKYRPRDLKMSAKIILGESAKEIDDGPEHGYATVADYERGQEILDEMSALRKKEEEEATKLIRAWAVEKTMSDEEFHAKSEELRNSTQEAVEKLYQELIALPVKKESVARMIAQDAEDRKASKNRKVKIIYGSSPKEAKANKPIRVTLKQLDDYKNNYSYVEVIEESLTEDFDDLADRITAVLDDYGILYGDIVDYDDKVNIVGVDEDEWQEVVDAISAELGLDVLVPAEDHEELDDELIVMKESLIKEDLSSSELESKIASIKEKQIPAIEERIAKYKAEQEETKDENRKHTLDNKIAKAEKEINELNKRIADYEKKLEDAKASEAETKRKEAEERVSKIINPGRGHKAREQRFELTKEEKEAYKDFAEYLKDKVVSINIETSPKSVKLLRNCLPELKDNQYAVRKGTTSGGYPMKFGISAVLHAKDVDKCPKVYKNYFNANGDITEVSKVFPILRASFDVLEDKIATHDKDESLKEDIEKISFEAGKLDSEGQVIESEAKVFETVEEAVDYAKENNCDYVTGYVYKEKETPSSSFSVWKKEESKKLSEDVKEELYIKYWQTAEDREKDISDVYLDEFESREDAIDIAKKLVDRDDFSAVEVYVVEEPTDKLIFGYDGIETWSKMKESLEETKRKKKKDSMHVSLGGDAKKSAEMFNHMMNVGDTSCETTISESAHKFEVHFDHDDMEAQHGGKKQFNTKEEAQEEGRKLSPNSDMWYVIEIDENGKVVESLKESFEEIYIKYWEDEELRDQGISEIYRDNFATREEAIEVARKMIDRDGMASVEVFVSPSGILESEDDVLVWGYDGVETWGLGKKEESLDEASSAEKRAFKHGKDDYADYVDGKAIARIKDDDERARAIANKRLAKKGKLGDRTPVDKEYARKVNQAEVAFDKKQQKMSKAGLKDED